MKKILVVSQHFWPEPFRLNDICAGLVSRGYCVEVLCGIPNYPQGRLYEGYGITKNRSQTYHGVKIRRALEITRGRNTSLRIFLNYISFPFFSLFHLPYLLKQNYDKIFLYQLSPVMMSFVGLLVGKLKHIESTMYVLDLWPENLFSVLNISNPILRKLSYSVSHWHYKKADKLIAISHKMEQRLLNITGKPKENILYLPQFCEKIYENAVVDDALISRFQGTFNIVFTGNLSPAQSLETILSVAKRLKNDGYEDIRWIIVGDGMSKKWLEEEIKQLGLTDIFSLEGFHPIEDIPKYTYISDALLACLRKSDMLDCTIPAKVMSYLAAGRPILLAMDGETQQMVNSINCGFAGPAGDVDALYQNVCRLYCMEYKERMEMGRRAKEFHLSNFERDISLDKLINFMYS